MRSVEERREHPADEGHRQREERDGGEPPAPEGDLQQEQDHDRRDRRPEHQPLRGGLALGELAEDLRVEALWEIDRRHRFLDVAGHRAEVAPAHVRADLDVAGEVLVEDHVRGRRDHHVSHLVKRDLRPAGCVQLQVLDRRDVAAHRGDPPDADVVHPAIGPEVAEPPRSR